MKSQRNVFPMTFPAILTAIVRVEETGGFSAKVPGLPGCVTEAETLDELRSFNLREATEGRLEAMGRPEKARQHARRVPLSCA